MGNEKAGRPGTAALMGGGAAAVKRRGLRMRTRKLAGSGQKKGAWGRGEEAERDFPSPLSSSTSPFPVTRPERSLPSSFFTHSNAP